MKTFLTSIEASDLPEPDKFRLKLRATRVEAQRKLHEDGPAGIEWAKTHLLKAASELKASIILGFPHSIVSMAVIEFLNSANLPHKKFTPNEVASMDLRGSAIMRNATQLEVQDCAYLCIDLCNEGGA